MSDSKPFCLHLQDDAFPKQNIVEDREIARAIVLYQDKLLFTHIQRDDAFGKLSYIETSGGGIEKGETPEKGLLRELSEELGVQGEILTYLGDVIDYYNLIGRRNHNHYFLVKATSLGENHLMPDEKYCFHLSKVSLTFKEAYQAYEEVKDTKLGHLVYQREVPVLKKAEALLKVNPTWMK